MAFAYDDCLADKQYPRIEIVASPVNDAVPSLRAVQDEEELVNKCARSPSGQLCFTDGEFASSWDLCLPSPTADGIRIKLAHAYAEDRLAIFLMDAFPKSLKGRFLLSGRALAKFPLEMIAEELGIKLYSNNGMDVLKAFFLVRGGRSFCLNLNHDLVQKGWPEVRLTRIEHGEDFEDGARTVFTPSGEELLRLAYRGLLQSKLQWKGLQLDAASRMAKLLWEQSNVRDLVEDQIGGFTIDHVSFSFADFVSAKLLRAIPVIRLMALLEHLPEGFKKAFDQIMAFKHLIDTGGKPESPPPKLWREVTFALYQLMRFSQATAKVRPQRIHVRDARAPAALLSCIEDLLQTAVCEREMVHAPLANELLELLKGSPELGRSECSRWRICKRQVNIILVRNAVLRFSQGEDLDLAHVTEWLSEINADFGDLGLDKGLTRRLRKLAHEARNMKHAANAA